MQVNSYWELFLKYLEYYFNFSVNNLTNLSFQNPFLWVAFWVVVCLLMEMFLPRKMEYSSFKRKGFWLDMFYVLLYDILFVAFGFYAFTALVDVMFKQFLLGFGVESLVLFDMSAYSVILQVAVLFVLQDLIEFIAHFLMHRVDFLWAFHKIHHAPEEISFASSRHFHWGEYFIGKPLMYIPFSMLGYSAPQYVYVVVTIFIFEAFFTHANVKTNFGFLNKIINNPETHYWHHAKNIPGRYGVNFASVLNIWDVLIGTYYCPKDKSLQPELGTDDSHEVPKGFFGQMIYPFKYLLTKKKKTNVFEQSEEK